MNASFASRLKGPAKNRALVAGAVAALCASPEAWAACPAAGSGIIATGAGVIVTETGCTISISTGPGLRYGISVNNQAQATLNGGSITSTGAGFHGILSQNGGIANFNNGTLSTSANYTDGVYARFGNATVNLSNVAVSSAQAGLSNGIGLNTNDTGRIFGTGLTVTTNSDNGHGASAMRTGLVDLSSTTITTLGTGSYGISSSDAGSQLFFRNGSSVTTVQSYNHAAYVARNSSLTIDNSRVATQALGAYGLYARDAATGNVLNGSSITTIGSGAYGIISYTDSLVNMANSTITTSGTSAIGAYVYGGSRIDLANSSVTTAGTGAYALYASAAAGRTNTFNVANTTLTSSNAASLYVNGGIANITFSGVTTSTGTSQFLIASGALTADPLYTPHDLSDPGSAGDRGPTGVATPQALNAANPATLNLVVDASTLNGSSRISNNSSANIALRNNTVMTGAFVTDAGSSTNFLHQSGSTWNITASSNVTNLSNEAGRINFAAPAAGVFKTLTTVNYFGSGGILGLNTQLGTDGSPSDKLVVNGGAAAGSSLLYITNAGGNGAVTTGNGILVVDAANAATTGANAFALGRPAVAGIYDYNLLRGSVDGSVPQSWFLRTAVNPPPLPPSPRPRPETSLYAVLPALGILYGGKLLDSLDERWGEETPWNGASAGLTGLRVAALGAGLGMRESGEGGEGEAKAPDGFWGRVIGQHGKRDDLAEAFPNGSPKYRHDFYALQAGLDIYRSDRRDGHKEHAGVYGAIGYGKGKVTHFDGTDAGENSFNAYSLGGYWTHFGPSNWYLDGILQATWYDAKANSNRGLPELGTKGMGYAASLEGGYPFRLRNGWLVEPQGQLIYGKLNLDDSSDPGGNVSFRDGDSLVGRLGVRIGRGKAPDEKRDPTASIGWLRLSVLHEFYGEPKVQFNGPNGPIPFRTDLGGDWWELKAGLTKQFERGRFLYATLGYQRSFDRNSYAYDAKVGVRIEW